MDNIQEKVIQIASDALNTDKSKISANSKLVDDLGADSLDQVELVMAMEEEFDCTIPDEDASKLITIADTVEYIKKQKSA